MVSPMKMLCTISLIAVAVSGAHAQEMTTVKWRTDYNAARKEAETKGLPMLIDFYTTRCIHCDRMDQSTFRDARILAALNGKYVPLKINGSEEPQLAEKLQIRLYPTIVLANPDGRITQTLVGYQDAEAMNDQLQRLLATLAPSDTLKRDFDNALKWEASGDYARAISAIKSVLEDDKGNPIQKQAAELLTRIEKRATDRLAQAKDLHAKGKPAEALEALSETLRQFPGLQASKDAGDMIARLVQDNNQLRVDQRNKRVRELLTQAQDFYKTKDYIPCLDRCELILANYGDLPEGQQAYALSAEIKNNPEWLQAAADVMTDRLGGMYLALADSYLKRGEVRLAKHYLERTIQAFPGSRLAESAQIRLTQLNAMPSRPDSQSARP